MGLKRPQPKTIRRSLTALAVVLALVGAGLIAYPFATDLLAARLQSGLSRQLRVAATEFRMQDVKVGDALTQLEIPRLGVDVVVVEGTSLAALRAGAGHYPKTPLPGDAGNVAIAGHRTTYGRPFNDMDKLVAGDRIMLTTPLGRYTYEVTRAPWVVDPRDWSPITKHPGRGAWLTLTSCHPEGSASHRIIVRAKLIDSSDSVAMERRR